MARRSSIGTLAAPLPSVTVLVIGLVVGVVSPAVTGFAQTPRLVKDIIVGPGSSSPLDLTAVGSWVFFAPVDAESGQYCNPGSATAPKPAPIWAVDQPGPGQRRKCLTFEAGDILYLRASTTSTALTCGRAIRAPDHRPVQDISPTAAPGSSPSQVRVQDYLFFVADDGSNGWSFGTRTTYASMIEDIRPGQVRHRGRRGVPSASTSRRRRRSTAPSCGDRPDAERPWRWRTSGPAHRVELTTTPPPERTSLHGEYGGHRTSCDDERQWLRGSGP
jgi:hypothetical protein